MHARLHCRLGSRSPYPPRGRTEPPLERAASGGSPQAGSLGGLEHPRPQPWLVSGSRTPDSGCPDRHQTPQRLPDTRVSCPGRGLRAAAGSDCGHSPPGPSSACLAVCLPNPTMVGPRPSPGSAGDFPPGAGYSSSHSDKGTRRPDSRGKGHCRARALEEATGSSL